jgi:hypothetical protein
MADAEPAFGTFENLEVGDRGQTLFADLEGCPEWLATILPMAFPSRSIEALPDVQTVTGNHYSMVVTAVSALGVYWPGCTVLQDLPKWYGAEIPEGVEFDPELAADIAAGGGMRRRNKQIEAAVDTSQIRRKFYAQSNWSWWIRAEKYDGDDEAMYLIVDDEETGELYKINVIVKGDEISFSDPIPVVEDHVPVAAKASIVAGMAAVEPRLAMHASRADTDDRPPTTEGASNMDEAQRLRLAASLSLPQDATPEQIQAKLMDNAIKASEQGPTPPATEPQTDPATPPATPPAQPDPAQQPSTPGEEDDDQRREREERERRERGDEEDGEIEAQMVTVDKKVWAETVEGARIAREGAVEARKSAIGDELKAALHAGKFKPVDEPIYKALLERDFAQGKAVLSTLQAGAVPVSERGGAGNSEDNLGNGDGMGLPTDWFQPKQFAAARGQSRGPVTQAKEG